MIPTYMCNGSGQLQEVILSEEEFCELDIDLIASSVAGLTDPIGQLKEWLEDLLKSIADFIVGGITSFISDVIEPFLEDIFNYLVYTIAPAISGVISAIVDFINTYILPAIDSLGQALSDIISDLRTSIASWLYDLMTSITSLSNALASGISSVIDSISQGISSLADSITNLGATISSIIQGIADTITSAISDVANTIVNAISQGISSLVGTISSAISGVLDALRNIADSIIGTIKDIATSLSQAISSIIDTISDVASTISSALASMIDTIVSTISDVASTIINAVSQGISSLADAIGGIIDTISSAISNLLDAISGAVGSIIDAVSRGISSLVDLISSAISGVLDALSNIAGSIVGVIQDVASSIANAIGGVLDAISGAISSILDFIGKIGASLSDLISHVIDGIASLGKTVLDAISGAVKGIVDVISDIASSIANAISGFVDTIVSTISQLWENISNIIGGAIDTIVNFIQTGFATVGDAINTLISGFQSLIQSISTEFANIGAVISKGFEGMGVAITGFINAILRFPEWFPKWFWETIAKPISDALGTLGQTLLSGIEGVIKWFEDFGETLGNFASQIWDMIKGGAETIWGGLQTFGGIILDALKWLGGIIFNALKGLYEMIEGGLKWLAEAFTKFGVSLVSGIANAVQEGLLGLGKSFVTITSNTVKGGIKLATEFGESIGKVITDVVKVTIEPMGMIVGETMEGTLSKLVEKLSSGEKITGEFLELMQLQGGFLGAIVLAQALSHGYWAVFHGLGSIFEHFEIRLPIRFSVSGKGKASPVGVGAEGEAKGESGVDTHLRINLGLMLRALASEMREYGKIFGASMMYGTGIWFSQPMMRLANSIFRNWLVVELPTIPDMLEMIRRHMSHEEYKKVLESVRGYLRLYGYNDAVIDWLTSEEEVIEVVDRFGRKRKVPISLMYNLPSASDVATMMVRDIFPSIEEFQKLYSARGMHPDVGALYYFLRYRYPPPERLWEFTMRGISGLLWVVLPDAEKRKLAETIGKLGAYTPISPTDLNFKARELFSSLKTYMKWHDYFTGAWIKGFTSDNLIMTDTLADIPTKIDQRWMVKWGLYELLSAKKVTIESPVSEFAEKVIENAPASKVTMDLTNFSRTLQATGIHPYWIPLTAVAESINALTDERTLLRTGFMNLFKEGFWDVGALEKLLKGIVMASFQVAYFDMKTMEWKKGWINHPVMFLPAERKLLELRALMDRSLDILREIQRDITRGYVEWIIETYEEYKDKLTGVIENINKFFTADYKAITGAELPDELKLKFVEEYYKPYVEALSIYKDVYTVRRIRYWTARFLGWTLYRVATGVVKPEDIVQLITYVKEYAKLTPKEEEYLMNITELISGFAIREYIPTPTQLATMSEYIVFSEELINKVFEARRVPDEWRKVWEDYINIRPIADDIRGLLTTYRRALIYVTIPEEIDKKVKEFANMINFTQREWDVLKLRVQLEELIRNSREYIPTPSMLVSFAEYITLPDQLIEKVFQKRGVPDEWREIWKKLIEVRPLADDVRGLLSAYRRALVYVKIPEEIDKKVKGYADLINFTAREWDILKLRVELEELIRQSREYLPTPSMLVSFAEYITIPDSLIEAVFTVRRVPDEWRKVWKQLIKVRPLADDVRGLLTTYRRALLYVEIPKEVDEAVKKYAKLINFTDVEWDILNLRVQLEELIRESREYIPTMYSLATISEYVPEARLFFDEVAKARRIPKRWQEVWAKYVDLRPIYSDVKRMYSRIEDMYVRLMITEDDYKKALQELTEFGYTQKEIELLFKASDYERQSYAWRELIGDVDRMTMLAEYSPKAREFALGTLEKMVDALPIDPQTKAVIKEMWKQFIRLKPIMDEVRRYITELISDFVEGVITEADFVAELEALRKWGLDDYEIMFYKAIAGMRKARYLKRRARGS